MPTSFMKISVWIKERDPNYMVFWRNMSLNFDIRGVKNVSVIGKASESLSY